MSKFTIPKSLAACADLLYTTRNERLAKDKEAAALKDREVALQEHLINNLPKSSATGIAGKLARITITKKTAVSVTDWDALYAYISKNRAKGAFALVQRRVSSAAVEELWEAGKEVPGCSRISVPSVSINKIGS